MTTTIIMIMTKVMAMMWAMTMHADDDAYDDDDIGYTKSDFKGDLTRLFSLAVL